MSGLVGILQNIENKENQEGKLLLRDYSIICLLFDYERRTKRKSKRNYLSLNILKISCLKIIAFVNYVFPVLMAHLALTRFQHPRK